MGTILCNKCGGAGELLLPTVINGRQGPPACHPCGCRTRAEQAARLEAVWPGLGSADPVESTNLDAWVRRDAVVSAPARTLQNHAARLLLDDQHLWATFDAVTDAELLSAQFTGGEGAVERMTMDPSLLILSLGVRRHANKILPGLVLTALAARRSARRPTWVVIDPALPVRRGLACWSEELAELLRALPQVKPGAAEAEAAPAVPPEDALAAAVRAAGGRLPRAEALALVGSPPAATFKRIVGKAGLRSTEDPPRSRQWFLVPQE